MRPEFLDEVAIFVPAFDVERGPDDAVVNTRKNVVERKLKLHSQDESQQGPSTERVYEKTSRFAKR
jgi:hypothetical protein